MGGKGGCYNCYNVINVDKIILCGDGRCIGEGYMCC